MGRTAPLQGGVLVRLAVGLQSLPVAWSNAQRPAATVGPCLGKNCVQTTKSLISLQCYIFPAPYNFGNGI